MVVDDMIASGESMLDVAKKMKEMGARRIYLSTSFALFTNGIEVFESAYKQGLFDQLYATNLTYIPENYMDRTWKNWLTIVDCMPYLSDIIYTLGNGESIQDLQNGKEKILELTRKKEIL